MKYPNPELLWKAVWLVWGRKQAAVTHQPITYEYKGFQIEIEWDREACAYIWYAFSDEGYLVASGMGEEIYDAHNEMADTIGHLSY